MHEGAWRGLHLFSEGPPFAYTEYHLLRPLGAAQAVVTKKSPGGLRASCLPGVIARPSSCRVQPRRAETQTSDRVMRSRPTKKDWNAPPWRPCRNRPPVRWRTWRGTRSGSTTRTFSKASATRSLRRAKKRGVSN